MTTGTKHITPGGLLDSCTGRVEGVLAWDASERVGLVRVAFPTKLFEHEDGKFYTTDILHLMAGEGVCGLWEFAEAKLVDVEDSPASPVNVPGTRPRVRGRQGDNPLARRRTCLWNHPEADSGNYR